MIEYLRLAFGTAVVLLPGVAVGRAVGGRTVSALLGWASACVFVAWAVVFVVHADIRLAAAVLAAIGVGAALVARRSARRRPGARPSARRGRSDEETDRAPRLVWAAGIVLGWLLWHVSNAVVGDGLFHEARIRKLVLLGHLHLRTVDEFKDGGLHPGYAFPLWHGFLALVAWVSGVDAGRVLAHEPALLAPLAAVVAWEAGAAVFGSRAGGVSVLIATIALFVFGAGHGGALAQLGQPATAARQLFVPAAIALFFRPPSRANLAALAAVFGTLALVHPTYGLFLLIPLAGFAALRPGDWRQWTPAFAAAVIPTLLALLWLRPLIDETLSHDPGPGERARAIAQYTDQLVVRNEHHFRLAPEVFGRSGAVAVAALALLPVAALARGRRWAAFALGGSLVILVLLEVPWLFVHFSDAVSLSQSRRAAGFVPFAFVLAGVFAIAARSLLALPAALAGGIVLQRLWPGDFDIGLHHGGPALATWIGLFGGAVALGVALLLRRGDVRERHHLGAVVTACFVLPVVVHGIGHWSPSTPTDPLALQPGLVHELRTEVPHGAIVLASVPVSYRVVAAAPVYVVAVPPIHVANTRANDPYGRARAVDHWVATGDPAVARRYGATWAIRKGHLYRLVAGTIVLAR